MGLRTEGPTLLITDLCIMSPDTATKEFVVRSLHPGVTRGEVRQNTGWDIRFDETLKETPPPDVSQLEALRDLNARTAAAHGVAAAD